MEVQVQQSTTLCAKSKEKVLDCLGKVYSCSFGNSTHWMLQTFEDNVPSASHVKARIWSELHFQLQTMTFAQISQSFSGKRNIIPYADPTAGSKFALCCWLFADVLRVHIYIICLLCKILVFCLCVYIYLHVFCTVDHCEYVCTYVRMYVCTYVRM